MYPHIARSDSFYTDTDSVVLGSPLPDDWVSSTEIGKFRKTVSRRVSSWPLRAII